MPSQSGSAPLQPHNSHDSSDSNESSNNSSQAIENCDEDDTFCVNNDVDLESQVLRKQQWIQESKLAPECSFISDIKMIDWDF